jgi:hypothetical protein
MQIEQGRGIHAASPDDFSSALEYNRTQYLVVHGSGMNAALLPGLHRQNIDRD